MFLCVVIHTHHIWIIVNTSSPTVFIPKLVYMKTKGDCKLKISDCFSLKNSSRDNPERIETW